MLGISCYSSKIWARQILLKYSFSFNRQVILTADESKRPKQGIILRSSDSGRTFHSIRLPFQPSLPMIYHSSHSDHLLAYSTDVSKLRARCILKVCICLHHDWLCAFQDVQGWVVGNSEGCSVLCWDIWNRLSICHLFLLAQHDLWLSQNFGTTWKKIHQFVYGCSW